MTDLVASLEEALSNPAVTAAIGVVGGGAVTYMLTRYASHQARRMHHSVELKEKALVPWSKTQVGRQSWHQDEAYGHPRLFTDPYDLAEQPVYRWARAHVENGYPGVQTTWLAVQPAVDLETSKVQVLKEKVRSAFADRVDGLYETDVRRGLSSSENQQGSVYLEDVIVSVIVQELWVVSARGRKAPVFNVTAAPYAPNTGARVSVDGQEIARLQWMITEPDLATWRLLLQSTFNGREVQDAMREVTTQDVVVVQTLKAFSDGMREIIQKIENGVPIKGKCELGF